MNIEQRTLLRYTSIIFGVLSRNYPLYLRNLVNSPDGIRHLRSTSQSLLSVARSRTEIGSRSFKKSSPTLWNRIPADVRKSVTIATFQAEMKKTYF